MKYFREIIPCCVVQFCFSSCKTFAIHLPMVSIGKVQTRLLNTTSNGRNSNRLLRAPVIRSRCRDASRRCKFERRTPYSAIVCSKACHLKTSFRLKNRYFRLACKCKWSKCSAMNYKMRHFTRNY